MKKKYSVSIEALMRYFDFNVVKEICRLQIVNSNANCFLQWKRNNKLFNTAGIDNIILEEEIIKGMIDTASNFNEFLETYASINKCSRSILTRFKSLLDEKFHKFELNECEVDRIITERGELHKKLEPGSSDEKHHLSLISHMFEIVA